MSAQAKSGTQTLGKVPVRNLWLLLFYASELYQSLPKDQRGALEEAPDELPDLIAELFCRGMERRLHRNLTPGYQPRQARLSRLRGRVDLLQIQRHQLLAKGQIACRFEELTFNTVRNRYFRAALDTLSRTVRRTSLATRCRTLVQTFSAAGVAADKPERAALSRETFGRQDAQDRQLLLMAHLAFDLALPDEHIGRYQHSAPNRDLKLVRKLFEKGVAGLYRHALTDEGWQVKAGRRIKWQIDAMSVGMEAILPTMQTDIELCRGEQQIVIDTKFNGPLTKGRFRKKSLRSGYIYQMYSYLRSQEQLDQPATLSSAGVLLHPCITKPLKEWVKIQGHWIGIVTVDLTASAKEVRNELLNVIEVALSRL